MTTQTIVVLNGVIGSGKTTLGQRLARRLRGLFLDSDNVRDHTRPWFVDVRGAHLRLMAQVSDHDTTVIAEPLRLRDWLHLKRLATPREIDCFCITLAAGEDAILAPDRGRVFSAGEHARIHQMIAEGYDRRPFSDAIVRTDVHGIEQTVDELEMICRKLLTMKPPTSLAHKVT